MDSTAGRGRHRWPSSACQHRQAALTAGAGQSRAHEDAAVLDVLHACACGARVPGDGSKTEWTFYAFAAVLGATWLATVPPTVGLTAKLFGTRYLATLFGLTLLSHQIGGFFGAWLGGIAITHSGNYLWMWWADIVLALAAALVNLPIREARPQLLVAAAA